MNTLDKVLLVFLAIQFIFAIVYLLYQFEKIDIDDKVIQCVITFLNIIETVLLIMTRFMDYGRWGLFALGSWYVLNTIMLVMQLVLAEWNWTFKVQNVLWIGFYVFLFCLDILHINLIMGLLSKYSPTLLAFGERIQGTFWADLIKALLIALIKGVLSILVTAKSDD